MVAVDNHYTLLMVYQWIIAILGQLVCGVEQMVVVAETRKKDPEVRGKLAAAVRKRVNSVIRVSPDAVELVPPRTVPKTPSGKLRRAECRDRYLNHALVPRRLPAWVQVVRLGGAAAVAAGAYFLTQLWRRRSAGGAGEE